VLIGIPWSVVSGKSRPLLSLELWGTAKTFTPFERWSSIHSQSFSGSGLSLEEKGISGTFVSRKKTFRWRLPPPGAEVHVPDFMLPPRFRLAWQILSHEGCMGLSAKSDRWSGQLS